MVNDKKVASCAKAPPLWIFALAVFFAVSMNRDWQSIRLIWYGSIAFVAISYLIAFNGKFILSRTSYWKWMLSFAALGAISLLWSIFATVVFDILKTYVVFFIVLFLVQCSLEYKFSIDTLLNIYFFATIVNALYIVLVIDLEQLGEIQLGVGVIEGWNGNGIGFMMAQGALIGCYLMQKSRSRFSKFFYLISAVALSLLAVYTGSRTAFIMMVAGFILYYSFTHPTKLIRNIAIFAGGILLALYLVMEIDAFYAVLGYRLEGLWALFTGEGEADSSASIRQIFIDNGMKWFSENPIIGIGLNNYKVLNQGATGRFTYAHNNFVELAVDLGIVGFALYYFAYAYLIVRLLKVIKNNPFNSMLLAALVSSLLSHYGTVSYYDFYQNLLLLLCFYVVDKTKKEIG